MFICLNGLISVCDGVLVNIHSFILSLTDTAGFGARCSSVVSAFTHGVMGCWIDPSWWTH